MNRIDRIGVGRSSVKILFILSIPVNYLGHPCWDLAGRKWRGMKKAVVLGSRKAELVEVPDPRPKEDWVVVKVHAAPMCAEYKAFVGSTAVDRLGHEAAGEVVAVAQPGRVKEGDRVVVMPLYACGKCAL